MTITEDSVRNVNTAILKLKRDYETVLNFFEVNNVAAFEDKIKQAHILDNELKVYRYVVDQLLNLAQKWCVDNNSPVFWRVMKETMDSCDTCNAGQSECASAYYHQAFDSFSPITNQNCSDCQNLFETATEQIEGCGEEHNVCHSGYNSSTVQDCGNCYTGCQGCQECQNNDVDSENTYCYQNQGNATEYASDNQQNVILVHNNNFTDLNAALVKLQPLKDDVATMQNLSKELKTLAEKNFKDIMYIQYNLQYLESIKSLTNNFGRD